MLKQKLLPSVLFLFSIFFLTPTTAMAVPGDSVALVPLTVPGFGVSVGVDCEGVVYYTGGSQTGAPFRTELHSMDAAGNPIASIPITDSVTGLPVEIDEMAWDETRMVLWAQEHGSNPVNVYHLNTSTGVATFQWQSVTNSAGTFRDGIAYDGTDDTIWISGDVSNTIEHYTSAGVFINQITPTNAAGGTLGLISGVMVGVGDLLYLGRNGAVEIVQVRKSDGAFISVFASPEGNRDEGLECDVVNFPVTTLWSRDNTMNVIEIEPGTCECGGGGVLTCTKGFWKNHPNEWTSLAPNGSPVWSSLTYLQIFNEPPRRGDASIILAHALIAALLNSGADPGLLAAADALLVAHPVGPMSLKAGRHADPDRAVALDLAEQLQAFNESTECTLP